MIRKMLRTTNVYYLSALTSTTKCVATLFLHLFFSKLVQQEGSPTGLVDGRVEKVSISPSLFNRFAFFVGALFILDW